MSITAIAQTFRTKKRERAFRRTDGHCFYCGCDLAADNEYVPLEEGGYTEPPGKKFMQLDHMTPKCLGGTLRSENVAPACEYCNARKGGRSVEAYRLWLCSKRGEPVIFYGDKS